MLDTVELSKAVATASAILGVDAMASPREVRMAWKRKAFEFHPDRGTGTDADLIRINEAYDILKNRSPEMVRRDPPEARRTTTSQPRRPSIHGRTIVLTREEVSVCKAALSNRPDADATDHVAKAIDRTGRKITYTVSSGLDIGLNRVAVPTGFLVDNRSVVPVIVQLETQTRGSATYLVPEATRAALFKGASEVRIRFANIA